MTLTNTILVRLTPEQHELVRAMGGTPWVRSLVKVKMSEKESKQ